MNEFKLIDKPEKMKDDKLITPKARAFDIEEDTVHTNKYLDTQKATSDKINDED